MAKPMADNAVCYGILVVLSGLLAVTVRNGWLLAIIAKQAAAAVAENLAQMDSFRCRANQLPKTVDPSGAHPSPPLS